MNALATARTDFRRSAGVVWTRVDDRIAVAHPGRGDERIDLSGIAVMLWDLLDEPATVEGLAASVATRYDIDPNVAACDVRAFLEGLVLRGVVKRVDGAPS